MHDAARAPPTPQFTLMTSIRTAATAPARLSVLVGAALLGVVPSLSGCLIAPPPDHHGLRALESNRFLTGAWLGEWPSAKTSNIRAFQEQTDVRLDLVDIYLDWATPVENVSHAVEAVAATGAIAVLTWEVRSE
ncbi:MAG: hypothetical protein WC876_11125, partial [Candidatus Thermoplasmatota archaeon]